MKTDVELTRLWREGSGSDGDQQSMHWSWEQYAKYSSCKPLDYWIEQSFLFLIGQAGAGKSTYLKQIGERSDMLVVGIKEHGASFWDAVTNDPKWKAFVMPSEEEKPPFTLIIDGWDELTEEPETRNRFVRAISDLDSSLHSKLRLRIASRPELPEQKVLEALRNECPWLISGIQGEASDRHHRLVLAPLCRDQAESLWIHFGNDNPFPSFWSWAYQKGISDWFGHVQTLRHLIDAFTTGREWNSERELWEEVLQNKLAEEDSRKVDIQRTQSLPTSVKLMDAAGELALLYLLGERCPIPHTDASNLAGRLPIYGCLTRDAQRFLLSTPIFTPGGLENIHFSQAQEAEFLSARRLHIANVGLDNQIRLFTSEHGVPDPLQGLCKWLAKYDSDWLNYLSEHHPVMALKSLDSLMDANTRERVVKRWWTHPQTNRNDWDHIRLASLYIPDQTLPWIEEELRKLTPATNARSIASWLGCLADRHVSTGFLGHLVSLLDDLSLEPELITSILDILAKRSYGDKPFWLKASSQWLESKRGERIAAIASQRQRHGGTTQEILSLFRPVSATHQSYRYTEYLRKFFSTLEPENLDSAVNWLDQLSIRGYSSGYKYSWFGVAIEGLIESLLRSQNINGLLQVEVRLWKDNSSFESILSEEKECKTLLTDEIIGKMQDALIDSDIYLLKYKERGWLRSQWLLLNAHEKLFNAFSIEVKNQGYSRRADLLLSILRFLGVNWSDYLDLLYHAKQEIDLRMNPSEVKDNPLTGILGPRILGSDSASEERKLHFDTKRDQRQSEERTHKQERQKAVAWKEFYKREADFKEMEWSDIFYWLSYGYHIEHGYLMALPMDAFLHPFWKQKLSDRTRTILFTKAKEYITTFQWKEIWTQDFAQKKSKSTSQFTTHSVTIAPLFAWKWVWHELGEHKFSSEFQRIERGLWLKYLWAMETYQHEILDPCHGRFLYQGMNALILQQQWLYQMELLEESTSIPQFFLKESSGPIHDFVKGLFTAPFQYPMDEGALQTYAQDNGPEFLQSWFDHWSARQIQGRIENWEQLRFLLKRGLEPAWNWFLDYCTQNSSDVESRFRELNLSRDSRGLSAFSHWSEETLTKCITIVQTHFPYKTDPPHDGAVSPNWRDNMADFRNALLNILLDHSDWDLNRILRNLKVKIPDFDPWDFIDQKARQNMANHRLAKMDAIQIASLLDSRGVVILKDERDLTEWISSLIQEFSDSTLNGENGLATLLWDEHVKLKKTPIVRGLKHEEAFSDLLFHWLQWRKLKSPLVPKREVQIYRRSMRNLNPSPNEEGQRIDMDLEFHSGRSLLRLTIEVKRDTNREWNKAGLFQLRDYLKRLKINHGIYIVYGKCKNGKASMLKLLVPHLQAIKQEGYLIHPIIIDI